MGAQEKKGQDDMTEGELGKSLQMGRYGKNNGGSFNQTRKKTGTNGKRKKKQRSPDENEKRRRPKEKTLRDSAYQKEKQTIRKITLGGVTGKQTTAGHTKKSPRRINPFPQEKKTAGWGKREKNNPPGRGRGSQCRRSGGRWGKVCEKTQDGQIFRRLPKAT